MIVCLHDRRHRDTKWQCMKKRARSAAGGRASRTIDSSQCGPDRTGPGPDIYGRGILSFENQLAGARACVDSCSYF